MNILGIADGFDSGACLIMNNKLVAVAEQERFDGVPHSHGFPWDAVDSVLKTAGITASEVDRLAVAGRITPPFFFRRHPRVRALVQKPFSPFWDLATFYQAMLRQTGLSALEADRTEAWFMEVVGKRGIVPDRVVLVDTHKALAHAAFRTQDESDALVLTLHPLGDGVAAAAHHAIAGQINTVFEQRGFASLHVYLRRALHSIGLTPDLDNDRAWIMAGRDAPDPSVVRLLNARLRSVGPKLSTKRYPLPSRPNGPAFEALRQLPPYEGAACIYKNLFDTVSGFVRHHLANTGVDNLVVGGAVFDNARLIYDLSQLDAVGKISVCPSAGHGSLAIGAGVVAAGLAPRHLPPSGLGEDIGEADDSAALACLLEGGVVGRAVGPGGFGFSAGGNRSIWCRADSETALRKAMVRFDRPVPFLPTLMILEEEVDQDFSKIEGPLHLGTALVPFSDSRVCSLALFAGRARLQLVNPKNNPLVGKWLLALKSETGFGAAAVAPLSMGQGAPVYNQKRALSLLSRCDEHVVGRNWKR